MLVISVVGLITIYTYAHASGINASGESLQHASLAASLVLVLALACGLIGYSDDMAKVSNKANHGLSAQLRLSFELLFGLVFAFILLAAPISLPAVQLPFHASVTLFSWFFVILSMFLVAATTNAVNLHDGMDGLSTGTSALILVVLTFMLCGTGQTDLAAIAAVAAGSLLAFLLFNIYPAKIFMGDTGSLFIGGLLAGLALAGGLVFWFIPLTVIYIAETVSVIVQVTYFKLTKVYQPMKPISALSLIWLKLTKRLPGEGKRLLRMAPLHHHFEALMAEAGCPEWQVVFGFWLAQLLICTIVLVCFSLG